MKIIDMILNPKYATEGGKAEIITNCCPSEFGLKGDCTDNKGDCKKCWSKESEEEQ